MSKKGYNPPPLNVQLPVPPPSLPPKHSAILEKLAKAEARIKHLETEAEKMRDALAESEQRRRPL